MMKKALLVLAVSLLCATAADMEKVGEEFLRLRNWPVAISYFDQALEKNPASAKALYGRGLALCQLGKNDDGLASLGKALRLEPDNVDTIYVTGVCYEWKGKGYFDQAEAYYLKALQLRPKEPQLYHKLASLYQHEGKMLDAIANYKKAVALDPKYFISYNNLGACYLALQNPDEAVKLYRQAIVLSDYPGQYHFYQHLGIALLADNKPEEAKAAFLVETALNPDFPDAHNNLGNLYLLDRNFDRAMEEYREALDIDPKSPEANSNIAQLYLMLNQPENAIKYFLRFLALKPDDGKGHYLLSVAYTKMGNKDAAWREMNESMRLGYHPDELRAQLKGGK
jgi:tetratricopeptide (TPR) repeat protein